jgi:hypothetical protein
MFKYNQTLLKKIEEVYHEGGYAVRYEKGSFNNGYCVLEHKKVVVINKFHDLEAKINSLMEILTQIELDVSAMGEEPAKLYHKIRAEKADTLFS